MKKSSFKSGLLMFSIVLSISITACGFHYNIKGRVVDENTGKPIEGASIAIHWTGKKIDAVLAPYADGTYTVEIAKDISDEDGYFQIPYHALKSFDMGVYRKGYVCWDSRHIFLQREPIKIKDQFGIRTYDIKDRTGFKVRDGMVIELEPFTATELIVRARHASFVRSTSSVSGGLSGIGEEIQLHRKYYFHK
jgi:hypothetical protein